MFKKCIGIMSLVLIFMVLVSGMSFAGQWAKTYGGAGDDYGIVWPKGDGTYYLDAVTDSFGAGKLDGLIAKLTATGNVSWAKTFGGSGDDLLSAMDVTDGGFLADGGFFVSGMSRSFGTGNPASPNYNIVFAKFSSTWKPVFQKVIGGAGEETGYFITTKDQGFLFQGQSNSYGPSADDQDILLIKITSAGALKWKKAYHFSENDMITDVKELSDGFLVAATVEQPKTAPAVNNILIMKLDKATGNVLWKKLLSSPKGSLRGMQFFKANDGNYFLTGSLTPPPSYINPFGSMEILLAKLDPGTGAVPLSYTYGSSTSGVLSAANNLKINADGSMVVTGAILTLDLSDFSLTSSVLVMKLTAGLSIDWQKTLTAEGGIFASISNTGLLTGITASANNLAPADVLYAKLNPTTYAPVWARTFGGAGTEWGFLTKSGSKYLLSGGTESFGGATADKANIFGIVLDAKGNYPNCNVDPFNITTGKPDLTASGITLTQNTNFTLAERTVGAPANISLTVKPAKLQVKNICPAITAPADTMEGPEEGSLDLQQDAE